MIRLGNVDIAIAYQHYPVSTDENNQLFENLLQLRSTRIDRVENGIVLRHENGETYELCPGSFCSADRFYEAGHMIYSIEYNRNDILVVDNPVL